MPLLVQALGALFRALLNVAATWLVAKGVWQRDDATLYVAEFALVLATVVGTVLWSVWQKYGTEKTLRVGIEAPPGTPAAVVKAAAKQNITAVAMMTKGQ